MRKRIIGIAVVVSLLIILSSCSKWKPGSFVMPTWNTQLSLPIFNRLYTLEEILWKDSTTVTDGDTTFLRSAGSISVFSLFTTQPFSGVSYSNNLRFKSADLSYALTDQLSRGSTVPVPAIPPTTLPLQPDSSFQSFQAATLKSGTLEVTITNDYPANIILQNGIDLYDPSDGRAILNISVPGNTLASYQTYETSQPLAGITLPNNPYIRLTLSSPGSANPATIQTDTVVAVSFKLSDAVADSVSGVVHLGAPIALTTDTQKVDLGDFGRKFNGSVIFSDSTKLTLNLSLTGQFPDSIYIVLVPANSTIRNGPIYPVAVNTKIFPGKNVVYPGPAFVDALNRFSIATNTIPDEFIMNGFVVVNPGLPYVNGILTSSDELGGTGTINMPVYLGIMNATYIDTTAKPVFDSSTSAKMSDVDTASIVFEINNGLPLQDTLRTQLIDTVTGSITNLDSIIVHAPPATDFNTDGTIIAPIFSKKTVILTGSQAKEFGRSYMRFKWSFWTPLGDTTVPFTKKNTISLKVYGNLAFNVNKNTFK